MKRVLVVGKGSYIGEHFADYARGRLAVESVGTLQDEWKYISFTDYDSILHVAGIAHRKDRKADTELYRRVNCDLAVAVAQKAKEQGVKQFVFMSSLYAFGVKSGKIISQTAGMCKDDYGQSKLRAEQLLQGLADERFCLACVRPPMVYGPGCKGNFPQLIRISKLLPVYPKIENKRSMVYINNLLECLIMIIEDKKSGRFCPQNYEYTNTSEMMVEIAAAFGKKRGRTRILNPAVKAGMIFHSGLRTAFSSLYYEPEAAGQKQPYQVISLKDSISESING